MWVFLGLVAGLTVAAAVLVSELRKWLRHQRWRLVLGKRLRAAWRAFKFPDRSTRERGPGGVALVEPFPAVAPELGRRWCRASETATMDRCQRRRLRTTSAIVSTVSGSSVPPSMLQTGSRGRAVSSQRPQASSRPGQLVRPEAYAEAPSPPVGARDRVAWSRSVEIDLDDLEDLVDTQPSVVLTAAEADEVLGAAWDERETQPRVDRARLG